MKTTMIIKSEKINSYYKLTKPGIIKGNLLSVVAGYFIGLVGNNFSLSVFLAVITGASLIMASGCIFNNYMDREIDKKMERTKNRITATGNIKPFNLFLFGAILLILGALSLYIFTNNLTLLSGLAGFILYVFIYGYFKRRSTHSTLIGSLSGAVPPLAGYLAASNNLDIGALLVFLTLVFWQMPHFYAISMFRLNDYKKANIPLLSVVKGKKRTKNEMYIYMILFGCIPFLMLLNDVVGFFYLFVMSLASFYWIYKSYKSRSHDSVAWSKKVFGVSLMILLVFCFSSIINYVLFI